MPNDDVRGSRQPDPHSAMILHVLEAASRNVACTMDALSKTTGIPLNEVRSICITLEDWELMRFSRDRTLLTQWGVMLLDSMPLTMVEPPDTDILKGHVQKAVIVRGGAANVTDGTEQRDLGMSLGATGLSTFAMVDGRIILPGVPDMDECFPGLAEKVGGVGLREGDALVVAGSDDPLTSKLIAFEVALALMKARSQSDF
ncbi:MAG: hypothetical protein IKD00_06970 [Candidatus Methanomethylophilaceae archaeon]|nr:hypothetical protein [Candidatus Methanomethylophilaceae archaeon]